MVSPNELTGLQGFLLSRVGAFPAHPRLDFVSHVLNQFKKGEPFVIFPEGNVWRNGHTFRLYYKMVNGLRNYAGEDGTPYFEG